MDETYTELVSTLLRDAQLDYSPTSLRKLKQLLFHFNLHCVNAEIENVAEEQEIEIAHL